MSATGLYEEGLAIERELKNPLGIAWSLCSLGEVAIASGDLVAARRLLEESLSVRRQLGHRLGIAWTSASLGDLAWEESDHTSARSFYSESLAVCTELGDRLGIPARLDRLASVAAAQGVPDRAARLWGAAERLREETGSPLPANERSRYDVQVAAARSAAQSILGEDGGFTAAWAEGRKMTLEKAIELALEDPDA